MSGLEEYTIIELWDIARDESDPRHQEARDIVKKIFKKMNSPFEAQF